MTSSMYVGSVVMLGKHSHRRGIKGPGGAVLVWDKAVVERLDEYKWRTAGDTPPLTTTLYSGEDTRITYTTPEHGESTRSASLLW